jgi:hypothetical protein
VTQQEVAQAVLASLQQTGFKQPVWIKLSDGSGFQGIITGLNGIILYAARSETSSNSWNFRVINEANGSA